MKRKSGKEHILRENEVDHLRTGNNIPPIRNFVVTFYFSTGTSRKLKVLI